MPLDYSKWDKLNCSSDEDEPSEGVPTRSASVTGSRHAAGSCGDAALPTDAMLPSSEVAQSIRSMNINCQELHFCWGCKQLKPISESKKCGRCRQATYCSKQCQIAAWPSHKTDCTSYELGDVFSHSKRVLIEIVDLVTQFPDRPIFHEAGCIDSSLAAVLKVDSPSRLNGSVGGINFDAFYNTESGFSFASLAQYLRTHYGDGLLVFYFANISECEDMAAGMALKYRGSHCKALSCVPKVGFVLWPLERLPDVRPDCEFQKTMAKQLSGALSYGHDASSVMALVTAEPEKVFALCTMVAPSAVGLSDGATEIRSVPFSNPYEIGISRVGGGKAKTKTLTAADDSKKVAYMISEDPSFRECRQLMFQLRPERASGQQVTEGVIWLKNIIPDSSGVYNNGYEGSKGLASITPTGLKAAIRSRLSLKKVRSLTSSIPVAFFSLEKHRDILEGLQPGLCTELGKINLADPDIIRGFFLTYVHKSSDQFILSRFYMKRKQDLDSAPALAGV